ncbi:hypothetical protein GLW08_16580 [Pontibacillus yanchengensis]|uniref:Uncharacterized protein n=2 Tax=Pontibacillus yanchengensis TaxID=462910 RepID=A0ACC7VJT5_9BACI|nr:hypothetical protein [Pontibacillus yanchengensis]MYL32558.1 hypothetical protein [Pontibacillus yanchengensis]MYL54952.1 hypothetical protein [Pontibacillus yanchengensis]
MELGLVTFLVVVLLLVAWLLVSILSPGSDDTQNALKSAVCSILECGS